MFNQSTANPMKPFDRTKDEAVLHTKRWFQAADALGNGAKAQLTLSVEKTIDLANWAVEVSRRTGKPSVDITVFQSQYNANGQLVPPQFLPRVVLPAQRYTVPAQTPVQQGVPAYNPVPAYNAAPAPVQSNEVAALSAQVALLMQMVTASAAAAAPKHPLTTDSHDETQVYNEQDSTAEVEVP